MAASLARKPWESKPTRLRRSSATGVASTSSSSSIPFWSTGCSCSFPRSPADARPRHRRHRDLLRPHRLHRLQNGPRQPGHRGLLPREARHALVRHRSFGDGHPGERHHSHRDDGTGLCGWNAFHPALLRPSAGDGDPLCHSAPVLLPRPSLHRLRVPRKALRRKDPQSHELPVPAGPRAIRRRGDLRPLGHPRDRLRSRRENSDRPHRRWSHGLYRPRRHAGGDVGRGVAGEDNLPGDVSLVAAVKIAGAAGRTETVDFTFDPSVTYTFWSGVVGGIFLMLSYFGCDQSQVQRYLTGRSLAESRLSLLFNAMLKIPMPFVILLTGALLFVFS